MVVVFLSFVIIALSLAGLGLGMLLGGAPIKGSCGGLACLSHAECNGCTHKNQGGAEL